MSKPKPDEDVKLVHIGTMAFRRRGRMIKHKIYVNLETMEQTICK